MGMITGTAKRFDNTAIDNVTLFEWFTGRLITRINPNSDGSWSFGYQADMAVGVTYIAAGCEPITHGPYQLIVNDTGLRGFLLLSISDSGTKYSPQYDKTATDHVDWIGNFALMLDVGLLNYKTAVAGVAENLWQSKIINAFDLSWVLELYGGNRGWRYDKHKWTFEILDAFDNVLFALQSEYWTSLTSQLSYGENLDSLVATGSSGSAETKGLLKFSNTGVTYETTQTANFNMPFSYDVDLSQAVKVRVGGESLSSGASVTAGGYILILPKTV